MIRRPPRSPLFPSTPLSRSPTADTVLSVADRDPLLVRWQYGLGRAAVFTSDAKSRWAAGWLTDRKSTRLNSSHTVISYAVFCLKKKKNTQTSYSPTRLV